MINYKYLFLLIFFVVTGCSLLPEKQDPPAVFDLGPQRAAITGGPRVNATLLISPVSATPLLDSPNIIYRLNYQDAGRTETYAQHRWAASPAVMLTERIRTRFAAASRGMVTPQDGARADYALRVELEEFGQTFETAQSSKAVVRLRASLIDLNTRALHAQRMLSVERPAGSNAPGAAKGLAEAGEAAVDGLLEWAAQQIK